MNAHELQVPDGEAAARVVRALGQHRYVGGRLHLVHAFAFRALDESPELAEAIDWARGVMADASIDKASRDERLFRRSTETELAQILAAVWGTGAVRERTHARLREHLWAAELPVPDHAPFDEAREDETFPVLVDAGWELLPLAGLDAERHKGVIQSFGEPILWDAAIFEEQSRVEPAPYLQELPAFGPAELLAGARDDGTLAAPLPVWTSGPETYHGYVLRGVLRAAKIEG
jgi:hypothetical protein